MAQIINFEKMSVKKAVNDRLGFDQLEYEILVTVMRYIYAYMEEEVVNPIETIHPKASIAELLGNDRQRFAHVYVDLMKYWELENVEWEEIPMDKEFEVFDTVESLCVYLDKKVTEKVQINKWIF